MPKADDYRPLEETEMATTLGDDNPMEQMRNQAWQEYARGTFSDTDRKIFNYAFERGWSAHIQKSFDDFKHNRELGVRARKTVRRQ